MYVNKIICGGYIMNTLNQVFLLNNINFIFTTTIMFMIIFIYSLERRSRYISFLIIYSIELILFLSFKQNFFNSYSINIAVIFIVKIFFFYTGAAVSCNTQVAHVRGVVDKGVMGDGK